MISRDQQSVTHNDVDENFDFIYYGEYFFLCLRLISLCFYKRVIDAQETSF